MFEEIYVWIGLMILIPSLCTWMLYYSILIVPQGKVVIVEEFGKFKLECGPGLHFLNPFTERTKRVNWRYQVESTTGGNTHSMIKNDCYVSTVPTIFDPPAITVTSKDKITIKVNVVVFYKVIAVQFAVYEIDDLYQALQQMIFISLRKSVSQLTLDELIGESKNSIAQDIFAQTSRQDWGIRVLQVEIQSITAPPEITRATEEMVRRKRESESKIQAEMVNRETQLFLMETEAKLKMAELKHNRVKLESQHLHQIEINKSEAEIKRLKFEGECQHKLMEQKQLSELQQLALARQKLEHAAEAERYKLLLGVEGITQEFLIRQLQAESFNKAMSSNKSVIVPYDAAQFLGTKQILTSVNL